MQALAEVRSCHQSQRLAAKVVPAAKWCLLLRCYGLLR